MSTGLMTAYGNNTTGGGSGVLPSSNRSQNQDSHNRSQNRDLQNPSRTLHQRLRPDWQQYKVDVKSQTRDKARGLGQTRNAESGSMKSDGSEQMIIHHNVEFEITDNA